MFQRSWQYCFVYKLDNWHQYCARPLLKMRKKSFLDLILTVSTLSPPPLPGHKMIPLPLQNLTDIGKRTSFRYRYLDISGQCLLRKPSGLSISIAATNNVMDRALTVACHTLAKITRYMPHEVFVSTSKSEGVGIFAKAETLAAYPQNANGADRPECYGQCDGNCQNTCTSTGNKWAPFAHYTNSISLVNMESVLCLPGDPYGGIENIIVDAFSNLVHLYMPTTWENKISAAYRHYKLWQMNSYSMADEYTYFSMASEIFLGSNKRTDTGSTGGMNRCFGTEICKSKMDARKWLQEHDPWLYEILLYVYTNNDDSEHFNIDPCEK